MVGATNYRGQILLTGEGQGDYKAPALWVMDPKNPYNTTSSLSTWNTQMISNSNSQQFSSTTTLVGNSTL